MKQNILEWICSMQTSIVKFWSNWQEVWTMSPKHPTMEAATVEHCEILVKLTKVNVHKVSKHHFQNYFTIHCYIAFFIAWWKKPVFIHMTKLAVIPKHRSSVAKQKFLGLFFCIYSPWCNSAFIHHCVIAIMPSLMRETLATWLDKQEEKLLKKQQSSSQST